jgi:hypothetical protein
MISGIVRMVRRKVQVQYAAFGAVSAALLLFWYFPPNERFILPLAPLLLSGLIVELEHLFTMLRKAMSHKDLSQRIVAVGFGVFLGLILAAAVAAQFYTTLVLMPGSGQSRREMAQEKHEMYAWIRSNLPQNAGFVAYEDPVLYLQTGHPAMTLNLPPKYWYREDRAGMVGFYSRIADFATAHGLGFVYFTSNDFGREMGEEDKAAVMKEIAANPRLAVIHQTKTGTIYRVR